MYEYRAKVVKVYDGDTITVITDLGFKIYSKMVLRLGRINTPEIRGEERESGLISRDWVREMILDKDVIIKTEKDKTGKYGRYIADVYINDECINDKLVIEGLAVYYEY